MVVGSSKHKTLCVTKQNQTLFIPVLDQKMVLLLQLWFVTVLEDTDKLHCPTNTPLCV